MGCSAPVPRWEVFMLRLRDNMTTDFVTVSPELTIRDAMALLATRRAALELSRGRSWVVGSGRCVDDSVGGFSATSPWAQFAERSQEVSPRARVKAGSPSCARQIRDRGVDSSPTRSRNPTNPRTYRGPSPHFLPTVPAAENLGRAESLIDRGAGRNRTGE